MLQSRHYTNLYYFHLVPNKNLLVIDRVRRCSIKSLNSCFQNRNFRTRVQPTASTGLGSSATSDEKAKKFSILQLFNPYKDPQETVKKLLNQARLDEDERKQLKVPILSVLNFKIFKVCLEIRSAQLTAPSLSLAFFRSHLRKAIWPPRTR